jgi:hypothetical protein
VIEDQAYEALRYGGERIASIAALAARDGGIEASPVLYLGTFSKTVAPGLRIGWIAASVELVEKLTLAKQSADLQVSTLNQLVLADYAATHLDPHIGEVVALYRGRRDAMLTALDQHMPQSVTWTRPEGGMFVWLTLPETIDGASLLQRALTERGVAFVPGRAFFPDPDDGRHNIRLSFSTSSPDEIETGITALAGLVREMQ